eukprot:2662738-Amphidinium_carterae.1
MITLYIAWGDGCLVVAAKHCISPGTLSASLLTMFVSTLPTCAFKNGAMPREASKMTFSWSFWDIDPNLSRNGEIGQKM